MAANVVVAPVPDTPGYYPLYASRSSVILGGLQIGAGIISVILSVVILFATESSNLPAHIVFGVVIVIAGALGIVAAKLKTTCPIVGFMVLSVIVSVFALYAFFAFILVGIVITIILSGEPGRFVVIAVLYVLIVVYLVEAIASIWSVVICCKVMFCQRKQTPEVVIAYQHDKC